MPPFSLDSRQWPPRGILLLLCECLFCESALRYDLPSVRQRFLRSIYYEAALFGNMHRFVYVFCWHSSGIKGTCIDADSATVDCTRCQMFAITTLVSGNTIKSIIALIFLFVNQAIKCEGFSILAEKTILLFVINKSLFHWINVKNAWAALVDNAQMLATTMNRAYIISSI